MRTSIITALALTGLMASAQAADLDSLKDPLPDSITYKGVTVYGVLDIGYGYESNGLPNSGANYAAQMYSIYGNSKGTGVSNSNLTNNALSQSTVGIKMEENIGMGFTVIAKAETGFDPLYGELGDACQSLVRAANADINKTPIPSFGDGSRCGQAFNGEVYAGLSNAGYGTLTFGRQNTLDLDAMANYDPMGLSYALSLLGYSGTIGGGIGSTETARWDSSIKYVYQYGPVHAGVMYAEGGQDSSIHDNAIGANIGFTWRGLSVDANYQRENAAVNSLFGTLTGSDVNQLIYWLSDNEAYSIMAKYTWDLGGGFKDGGPSAKFIIYGGYQHSDQTNGDSSSVLGGTTIGGYILAQNANVLNTTRTLETAWAGAKYELPSGWSFTGAYYYFGQNNFSMNMVYGGNGGCAVNAAACSGSINQGSFLVDYAFNKHFDMYGGLNYSKAEGGLAHSFVNNVPFAATDNTTVVTGVRLRF